jgi:hypothetical protein
VPARSAAGRGDTTPRPGSDRPPRRGGLENPSGGSRGILGNPGARISLGSSPSNPVVRDPFAQAAGRGSLELSPGPRISFPPASEYPNQGAEELVFEDDPHEEPTARGPMPSALGQAEGHDAWTLDRMSRQSTVPPVRRDDFDRLRELSALPLGEAPTGTTRGGALDLVDRSRPLLPPDLVSEMEELYALDDLTGALRHAELILGRTPDNEQALRCAENCRSRLIQLYSSKIGRLDRVVVLALGDSQLRWLGLDHRSGFLLSRVDGFSTLEELLDVCGMPRLEALKTLADLLERGAIRFQ